MIAVVLDTNTLVSGLGWSGPPSVLVDALLAGELMLVSSPPLLDELERVLAYPKLAHVFDDPAGITILVRSVAEVVEPTSTLAAVADEPDNRVLEAAVEAGVDAVVTGDAGLLALVEFQGIPVMSAVKFLEWWADKEPPAAE
ncbi:MAG: putative toxin-antitoxin system toxin component, PIN family [Acidimicrobiales bacterium]